MRNATLAAMIFALFAPFALGGCTKKVPTDVVEHSVRSALRIHAPVTASAMCGLTVKGLVNAEITNVVRNKDGKSGKAHVSGAPWSAPGTPSSCEGDVEFSYTMQTRTSAPKNSTKHPSPTTTTTWHLDHLKLVAVQTKGVTLKSVDEAATDDEDSPVTR